MSTATATRQAAALREQLTEEHGINWAADVHSHSLAQLGALSDAARRWGYRKPAGASGSLGRYFFAYLQRQA